MKRPDDGMHYTKLQPKKKRQWAYPKDRVAHDAYDRLFKQQEIERRKQHEKAITDSNGHKAT